MQITNRFKEKSEGDRRGNEKQLLLLEINNNNNNHYYKKGSHLFQRLFVIILNHFLTVFFLSVFKRPVHLLY